MFEGLSHWDFQVLFFFSFSIYLKATYYLEYGWVLSPGKSLSFFSSLNNGILTHHFYVLRPSVRREVNWPSRLLLLLLILMLLLLLLFFPSSSKISYFSRLEPDTENGCKHYLFVFLNLCDIESHLNGRRHDFYLMRWWRAFRMFEENLWLRKIVEFTRF